MADKTRGEIKRILNLKDVSDFILEDKDIIKDVLVIYVKDGSHGIQHTEMSYSQIIFWLEIIKKEVLEDWQDDSEVMD